MNNSKRMKIAAIVMQVLEMQNLMESDYNSSDSSSDSDFEIFELLKNYKKIPRVPIRNYFEEIVCAYQPEEFTQHFRLRRETFNTLWQDYEKTEAYQKMLRQNPNRVLRPDKTLAIFLWFSGREACAFRNVSDKFNISISTVHAVVVRMTVYFSNLSPKVICWPTLAEMQREAALRENKSGIPGVIGCVDSTHIIIAPPAINKDDYIDHKGDASIIVQAVCNSHKKFIDVLIGFPGSAHDSEVFQNSKLPERLSQLPKGYRILADSAYPCYEQMLTAFKEIGLTPAQKHFNTTLSSQRIDIEHSFGILKQRFRQLYHCKLRGNKLLCHFIRACLVLHNIASENDFKFEYQKEAENDNASDQTNENTQLPPIQLLQNGNLLRDAVVQHLWNLKENR